MRTTPSLLSLSDCLFIQKTTSSNLKLESTRIDRNRCGFFNFYRIQYVLTATRLRLIVYLLLSCVKHGDAFMVYGQHIAGEEERDLLLLYKKWTMVGNMKMGDTRWTITEGGQHLRGI